MSKRRCFIGKTEFEFENKGVLNPAAIREGSTIHLFCHRAVRPGDYSRSGYCQRSRPLRSDGQFGDKLSIYCGADDERTVRASIHLRALPAKLLRYSKKISTVA